MIDYTDYKNLYLLCFTEDTEEDADFLFKTVLSKAEMVCEYENNKPIAMLFLMDADLITSKEKLPYYYLYAACTHPNHRGKGIMGKLLEKAKKKAVENGKNGIFLKPANPPLFDFYAKSNFSPFFKIAQINSNSNDFSPIEKYNGVIKDISIKDWHNKRKDFISPICDIYADFSKDLFTAATDGCTVKATDNSAIVYELREDLLLIKEAFCKKETSKELISLIATIIDNLKPEKIEIRLPVCFTEDFKYLGAVSKNFSVIWNNTTLPYDLYSSPYHGFAFD